MLNKNSVFVLNNNKVPCDPIHPAKARKLLSEGKAAVFRNYPFTIILKSESKPTKNYRIKVDPGAKFTGLALLSNSNIIWCAELEHRGFQISESLIKRRQVRRFRRNRKTRYRQHGISKSHWTDAACVGTSTPDSLNISNYQPLIIKAMGRGNRQMVKPDKYGFPKTKPKLRQKSFYGFQTGDIVKAVVTKGKKIGTYVGRVAVRKTGNFNIKTQTETVQGISYKYCKIIHKSDGYIYSFGELVKQESTNFVKKVVKVLDTPILLNLFDTSELTTVGVSVAKQSTNKSQKEKEKV
ncbi:MAG: hypothetical protein F6K15_01910 [Okeania sp. SIO2B3]|nr:hypothetical protein [Okeania sp. SIO2B3]